MGLRMLTIKKELASALRRIGHDGRCFCVFVLPKAPHWSLQFSLQTDFGIKINV